MDYRVLQDGHRAQLVQKLVLDLECQHYTNTAALADLEAQQDGLRARIDTLVAFLSGPPAEPATEAADDPVVP